MEKTINLKLNAGERNCLINIAGRYKYNLSHKPLNKLNKKNLNSLFKKILTIKKELVNDKK